MASKDFAPVVQMLDNFILWVSHYPTVSINAKIFKVFAHITVNTHTLCTSKQACIFYTLDSDLSTG